MPPNRQWPKARQSWPNPWSGRRRAVSGERRPGPIRRRRVEGAEVRQLESSRPSQIRIVTSAATIDVKPAAMIGAGLARCQFRSEAMMPAAIAARASSQITRAAICRHGSRSDPADSTASGARPVPTVKVMRPAESCPSAADLTDHLIWNVPCSASD